MYKLGLKLWSINTDCYLNEAIRLYDKNIYDYIELYVVPDTLNYLEKWKNLKIPFIIHCPHFAHGFNLARVEKKESNRKIFDEVQKYADTLNAPYIVIHGGTDGNIEETAKQLASFNDTRALIENKPYVALPNRMGGNFCRGYNYDEIKIVKDAANCGFCFDFGHAVCAANSLYDNLTLASDEKALITDTLPPCDETLGESFIDTLAPCGRGQGEGSEQLSHFYTKQSLNLSKKLRKNMTEPEKILWNYLKNRQINNLKFRRQEAIGNYIVDFVCYEKKLVIELDGREHLEASHVEHDKKRDMFLESNGYKVLRVFNNDVYNNIEGVIECILSIPSPNPLPQGERASIVPPSPDSAVPTSSALIMPSSPEEVVLYDLIPDKKDKLLINNTLAPCGRGQGEGSEGSDGAEGAQNAISVERLEYIYSYIETFLKLEPDMFHLTDIEDILSPYDSHPHLGTGQLDIKRILKLIPQGKNITVETVKDSKENLNDFIEDMKWLKN